MQNFGRGMWRRVGDYNRIYSPANDRVVLLQRYLQQYWNNVRAQREQLRTKQQHYVSEESVAEEHIAEEHMMEETIAEEHFTEEPIAEEPIAEESIAEEPVIQVKVTEESIRPKKAKRKNKK